MEKLLFKQFQQFKPFNPSRLESRNPFQTGLSLLNYLSSHTLFPPTVQPLRLVKVA